MRNKTIPLLIISLILSSCCNRAVKPAEYEIDYADTSNWISCPKVVHEVDVFYLYPTSWTPTEADSLVNTIDNASMRRKAPLAYSRQATCFEDFANIYAPFYRQVNAGKILSLSLEEQESVLCGIPYHDACAAFEHYITNHNDGRPFILAGHSQGSNVLKYLLSDYMAENPEVYKRMIAAYALGYSFEKSWFEKYSHLKFVEGETDTQVVITWNCEMMKDGKFGTYNLVCHEGALSINPVSWEHDYQQTDADDPRHLGSMKDPEEKYSTQVLYDPVRGYEVLIVGKPVPEKHRSSIGDMSLHGSDYSLYYNNIRENAKKRIESYKNTAL